MIQKKTNDKAHDKVVPSMGKKSFSKGERGQHPKRILNCVQVADTYPNKIIMTKNSNSHHGVSNTYLGVCDANPCPIHVQHDTTPI